MRAHSEFFLVLALTCACACACAADGAKEQGPDAGESLSDANPLVPDAAPPSLPSADYVFDDDALRTYELTVSDADLAWLNNNILLEEYVPATLRFEGRDIGQVGLRYKGSYGTLQSCVDDTGAKTCSKLAMKIKFNEYDPTLRFYGLKKLNFHAMNSDSSLMHDRLGYYLFRASGISAPRATHASLVINGENQGVFALVEQVDGRFTHNRFSDGGNGNLYKEVWPLYQRPGPYLSALKTNADQNPDVSPMVRFALALSSATAANIESVLSTWMDLDATMAYLAVDRAIENWDGAAGFWCIGGSCGNHNYYWYQGQSADLFTLIPWDLDNTFQTPNFLVERGQPLWDADPVDCTPVDIVYLPGIGQVGRRGASCDPLIRGLGVSLHARYVSAVQQFANGPFEETRVAALVDKWEAQIADAVAADSAGPGTVAWLAELDTFRASIATLRARVTAIATP